MQVKQALVGCQSEVVLVCMSVTGLCIVYLPVWHVKLMMPSRWRSCQGQGLEGQKTMPEQVQRYRRWLTAQQNFVCWPVDGIGGGQHGIVSTTLRALPSETFHVLGVRYMMRMHIPSYTYNKTTVEFNCCILPCQVVLRWLSQPFTPSGRDWLVRESQWDLDVSGVNQGSLKGSGNQYELVSSRCQSDFYQGC